MNEQAEIPETPEAAPGDAENPGPPPKTNLLGFILVPAVLVLLAVGIVWTLSYLVHDRRSVQDFSSQLRSPNKTERWQAALDLVDTNRASPDLIPILNEILDATDEQETLVKTGFNPREILKRPEEKQINLRWYATAALANIGGPDAYKRLLALTGDRDAGVRLYAVHGLARIRDPEAVPRLIEVLKKDDDGAVRATAAFALGEIADPRAIPGLRAIHENDLHQDAKWNAAIALARFADASARPTLEEMLRSDNANTRVEARKALKLIDKEPLK